MDGEELALLLLGLGGAYLVAERAGLIGPTGPASSTPALGVPPGKGPNLTTAIGGAIGAGACVAGGAALGAPQAGAAAAGLCALVGGKVAPLVAAGGKWFGKETAAAGKFVGAKVYSGASGAAREFTTNPAASVTVPTIAAGRLVGGASRLADRGITAAWDNSPAVVKIAAAPIYVPTKVTLAVASKAGAAVAKAGGALATGAKSAESAVSSGARKVLSVFSGW